MTSRSHLKPGTLHPLVLAGLLSTLLLHPTSQAQTLRAGFGSRSVTPNPLLPVSGGLGPTSPTSRAEGDLQVTALVLEQGTNHVAFVGVDFLGFPAALGNRIRKAVPEIPPDHILIGASHTHSAPDCYAFPDGKGGTFADLNYLDSVVSRVAAALHDAIRSLQPATLRIATGEAKGRIAYNYYAPDLYDPRVHVIQAIATSGKPIATLVNYAVHPEVIGSDRGITSPDLIGPLRERLQEKTGAPGLFMNSAQGGMVTADNRAQEGHERNTYAECTRIGQLLADEALRILQGAPIQTNPPLSILTRRVSFAVDNPRLRAVLSLSPLKPDLADDNHVVTRINLVTLGDAQILTIPGEALPNIGYFLKRHMKGKHNLLFGLTQDAFGYILTRVDFDSFKRYDYITRTSLGEQTGEHLIEEALQMISQSK